MLLAGLRISGLGSLRAAAIVVSLLLVGACGGSQTPVTPGPAPAGETDEDDEVTTAEFRCTQVIGFSQTKQWFVGAGDFERAVGDDRWQLLWKSGAGVERWADAGFPGWQEPLSSPCAESSNSPDRVVLTISGGARPIPERWAGPIRDAVEVVRQKLPGVELIVLQPVVGGPDHAICQHGDRDVRASINHPVIDEAIARVVGTDVVVGASPEVTVCSDYRDRLGHLTLDGAAEVARRLGEFYGSR